MTRNQAGRRVRAEVSTLTEIGGARGTAAGATAAPRLCCELRVSWRAAVGPAGGLVSMRGLCPGRRWSV